MRTPTIILATLLIYASTHSISAADNSRDDRLGRQIPNIVLSDVKGKELALADYPDKQLLVFVFLGTECPIGNSYIPDLNALAKKYKAENVGFVAVNSNPADEPAEIKRHAKEFNIQFPVVIDTDQIAADVFGAERTPEAFVLDKRRTIRYAGRIDDRIGYRFKRAKPLRADLDEAISDLLAGESPSVASTEVNGCKITRKADLLPQGKITYASHIATLLQSRCQNCHRPNTAAPFELLTYDDARNWSEMIKETVLQRRMPPWNADPRFGEFENELHMTPAEISMLTAWIDSGMPLGDKSKVPATPEYSDGWQIGEPDQIFSMPEEYKVKANGTVAYQYFVTPTNFKEDVWVQAAEARPGNWKAVHHIIVYHRPKGSKQYRRLKSLGGFAPGEEPTILPDGVGMRLPAGSELVWQLHYTPTGKPEVDRSEFAIKFCKEPPKKEADQVLAINTRFRIPPGADSHHVTASKTLYQPATLLALMPHMHVRGKSFTYRAKFPDGRVETLLSVPFYDFNWQHEYRLKTPMHLPAGTVIECEAYFDNSAENPANPDPEKWVTWGDQTWEEMMIGFFTITR